MAAQHKRPGRTAKQERQRRAKQRRIKVVIFNRPKKAMHGPGRVVAIAEVG